MRRVRPWSFPWNGEGQGREEGRPPHLQSQQGTAGQGVLLSPRADVKPLNVSPLHAPCCFLIPAFSLPDKRPTTFTGSFTGFQAPLLARRDSSLKRLTRWGSRDNKTPSPSSSDQQKSLNGEEDASSSASASEEDKLDLAPEN